jgi:hypothetical protein
MSEPAHADRRRELFREEDARHEELTALLERLTREQIEEPGYTEQWSVKDMLAHLASWMAEAAQVLEQLREDTYVSRRLDIEAMNQQFYEANKDQNLGTVRVELAASRNRMLQEWYALPEISEKAERWFRESGPAHYAEHLPGLRDWVERLTAEDPAP